MPACATRRTVLQKVRGSPYRGVPQLVNTGFQVLFHSPPGVLFTFPSQYYALSVTKEYLALRGGPRSFSQGSTCLDLLWIPLCPLRFHVRGFHPLRLAFPKPFHYPCRITSAVRTPACTHAGLGSFPFARRYSGNRVFFLLLRLLRCFSSPGSLPYVMDWRMDTWSLSRWVSPFRDLRIDGYLLLPEAYRSLSRLSSALGAKASALCSFLLGLSDAIALTSDGLLVFFLSLLSQCLVFVSILRLTYHQEMNVLHMRFSRYSAQQDLFSSVSLFCL